MAFTQGYNPRPRINIGLALPLGCTSEGDLVDLHLTEEISPGALLDAVRQAVPPGLEVEAVQNLEAGERKLQKRILACEYLIPLTSGTDDDELRGRITTLVSSEELPRERANKRYDLRPLILSLQIENGHGKQKAILRMRLTAREGATGRPDEVLLALGLNPTLHTPHRVRLILDD